MTEYGREARVTFDCAEYLGFDQTEAATDATLEPSEGGAEGLKIQVGTPVRLEVYAHPEALVRVYLRPHAPPQTLLRLLAKIGAAMTRSSYIPAHCRSERYANLHRPNTGDVEAVLVRSGHEHMVAGSKNRWLKREDPTRFAKIGTDLPQPVNSARGESQFPQ